ncbi:MAG: glycosyltransferase family 9 protein [Candidatus Riflebacteria bacterium]|nr:glycosyltransferase family 9 protein [Candidatus Riflebacteria bacterium]
MKVLNVLVSRTDRAGDLLLTMPIFRELKTAFPNCRITAHVRKYTASLLKMCPEVDALIIDDDYAPGIISQPLIEKLKNEEFDAAVLVHPSPRAIMSAFLAKIPKRIGRASNLFMPFLNVRKVQHRSKNVKHEFEYNLDLLAGLIDNINPLPYKINSFNDIKPLDSKSVVIHPGSGGSAYNIPVQKYLLLAEILVNHKISVYVSLGPGEEYLKEVFNKTLKDKINYIQNVPDFYELAKLFKLKSVFVGGSTGPLHLAAALNMFCVSFFPPVKAMTPNRWGPRGAESIVFKPDLPQCNGKCSKCPHNGCMQTIPMTPAAETIIKHFGD